MEIKNPFDFVDIWIKDIQVMSKSKRLKYYYQYYYFLSLMNKIIFYFIFFCYLFDYYLFKICPCGNGECCIELDSCYTIEDCSRTNFFF